MQEQEVTISGQHYELPKPFHVLATQNPIEQEGTYPLPEAQLDRFMFKLKVPFPDRDSLRALLGEGWDAVFVGSGAPRGRDLDVPGRAEAAAHIHIGIDWLSSVSFGHVTKIGRRVLVLGGGNTAMDCCRSARRLGGEDVKVVVRSGFDEMKASPWEKEDAQHEGIPILDFLVPKAVEHDAGRLVAMTFEKVKAVYTTDDTGRRKRELVPTGIFIELPEGYEAQVRPRSGLAVKQGITCLNTPGTIDADYRGEIKVILINLSQERQVIRHGDRIAQLVVQQVENVQWVETETIGQTVRNEGGFGHTGKQ
jgi:deoxyuridine 5'-triphosphate nucleotidohydrolase